MFKKKYIFASLLSFLILFLLLIYAYPVGYYLLEPTPPSLTQNITQGKRPYRDTGIFVINLDRSKDRYARILPSIEQLEIPYQRVAAIDGNDLSEEEIKQKVDFEAYKICLGHLPKRGTIGCSLSHIKAWKTFLESSYQYAFIMEDDVCFEPAYVSVLIKKMTQRLGGWDIVSFDLYHSADYLILQELSDLDKNKSENLMSRKEKLVLYLRANYNAGGYLITRFAAERLLSKCLPIKMPVDHYFSRGWELDLSFIGIEPHPITQNHHKSTYVSIIGTTSDDYSFTIENDPFRLYKKMFLDQTALIRFFYNLKLYIRNKMNNLLHDRDWSF